MKSIQQIVSNVMCQMTKISSKGSPDGIKGMARDIQKAVNESSLKVLGIILAEIDDELRRDKERQKNWEIVRKDDPKAIMTCVGELTYRRRYYRNKDTGEYKHLLDDWLNITPHQQIGEDVREDIVVSAVDLSYQKSGKSSAPEPVSKTSVGRYVKDMPVSATMQSDGKKRICKELYVEADEDHVALQNGKNVQVRLVYVHEGNISDNEKRAQLGHVRYLTWPVHGDTDDMWEAVATYIEEQYDTGKLERIWLSGDGAKWIDKGEEWLVKCQKLLDRYHVNKRFMSLTAQVSNLRGWGRHILRQGTKAQINVLYEHAAGKADTKNKQDQLVEDTRYFMSHWEQITARSADTPGCSAEGHVSHVLSARLSSRPMGWSEENLNQMAALRVMDANGMPIIYERKKVHKEVCAQPLSSKVLSAAAVNVRGRIDSAMKNIRLPILAAGQYTPTYMALRGLSDGHAV